MKPSTLANLLKRRAEGKSEEFIVLDVRDDDCLGGHIPGRFVFRSFNFLLANSSFVDPFLTLSPPVCSASIILRLSLRQNWIRW